MSDDQENPNPTVCRIFTCPWCENTYIRKDRTECDAPHYSGFMELELPKSVPIKKFPPRPRLGLKALGKQPTIKPPLP